MTEAVNYNPGVFDQSFEDLEKAMKIAAKRQAIISHNIANANTPDYEALKFDEVLGEAVVRENNKKVVLEKEMAELSENSLKYSSYVKLMSQKLGILRSIATQGRR